MNGKIRLGISSCLLGEKVRYDGGHKLDLYLRDTLGRFVEWVPVCPEVESGLPVPREAMRLVGSPESPRLVTRNTGVDQTERVLNWSKRRVAELQESGLAGFVFKSRSPSSGMQRVKIYNEAGLPAKSGTGIFAGVFMEAFPLLPVEDEGRLQDPSLRENFIERVFVFRRWQQLLEKGGRIADLIGFHTDHKLLILAHSPRHYTLLGSLIAEAGNYKTSDLGQKYISILMEGLKLLATVKKNTNVLHHIMGYFKKQLTREEKDELLSVIGDYHAGLIPLIVPVTLLRHYVKKYDQEYLKRQIYLNPHPAELMLRNHV